MKGDQANGYLEPNHVKTSLFSSFFLYFSNKVKDTFLASSHGGPRNWDKCWEQASLIFQHLYRTQFGGSSLTVMISFTGLQTLKWRWQLPQHHHAGLSLSTDMHKFRIMMKIISLFDSRNTICTTSSVTHEKIHEKFLQTAQSLTSNLKNGSSYFDWSRSEPGHAATEACDRLLFHRHWKGKQRRRVQELLCCGWGDTLRGCAGSATNRPPPGQFSTWNRALLARWRIFRVRARGCKAHDWRTQSPVQFPVGCFMAFLELSNETCLQVICCLPPTAGLSLTSNSMQSTLSYVKQQQIEHTSVINVAPAIARPAMVARTYRLTGWWNCSYSIFFPGARKKKENAMSIGTTFSSPSNFQRRVSWIWCAMQRFRQTFHRPK